MNSRSKTKALQHFFLVAGLLTGCTFPAGAQFPGQQEKVQGPWINKSLPPDRRADLVIEQMTLDEKISLLHGGGRRLHWIPLYLSIFDPDKHGWELVPGDYKVLVGGSSRETPLSGTFRVGGVR